MFVKTNKYTNYSFSLLIMYGSSYMGAYGGGKRAAQGVGGET
jgi:hypothetical protein